jgi:hypothetical protein
MALAPLKGRDLWRPNHWFSCKGNCPSCQVCLKYNLFRRFCHCGDPATGYRAMGAEADVEFFCNEHFQDVPAVTPPREEQP